MRAARAVRYAAALPISVQGLGLSQAAAVAFFSKYAVGPGMPDGSPPVLAYSLGMTTVAIIIQVVMGLAFLPAGRRLGLGEERPEPPRAGAPVVEVTDG